MGRSSKGNTENESRNMAKRFKDWSIDNWFKPEILRADTPVAASFAEASILARKHYARRESSFFNLDSFASVAATNVGLVTPSTPFSPGFNKASLVLPIPFRNSNDSTCSLVTTSDHSSDLENVFDVNLSNTILDNEFNMKLNTLSINAEKCPSEDSFSSRPDSKYNKGAAEFLALVERKLEEQRIKKEALGFDQLLVDMLDLGIQDKVATPSDIPEHLEQKGWHPTQVAGAWTSSSCSMDDFATWTESNLECLGGKGVLNKVWLQLKDRHLTRFQKRQAPSDLDQEPATYKRVRQDEDFPAVSKGTVRIVLCDNNEAHSHVSPHKVHPMFSSLLPSPRTPSQDPTRKPKRARRRAHLATPKITGWLKTPTTVPTPSILSPASETKTPSQRRRRYRKRRSQQAPSSSTPTTHQENSQSGPTMIPSLPAPVPPAVAAQEASKPSQVSTSAAKKCRTPSAGLKQLTPSDLRKQTARCNPGKDVMTARDK